MMSLGINLDDLLCSKVFEYEYEFDEWPSTHYDDSEMKMAYNGSIFNLREKYKEVLPDIKELTPKELKGKQMFKIVYKLNLLGTI